MKKFVMGLIIGVVITATGTAFADDIAALVGKTIQGQFPVTVDGEKLEMPAIVVDGTSFLPVRSFGESVGYAVYFDTEGAIRLEKAAGLTVTQQAVVEDKLLQGNLALKQWKVEELQKKIAETERKLAEFKKFYDENGGDPTQWESSKSYVYSTTEIAKARAELQELQ